MKLDAILEDLINHCAEIEGSNVEIEIKLPKAAFERFNAQFTPIERTPFNNTPSKISTLNYAFGVVKFIQE